MARGRKWSFVILSELRLYNFRKFKSIDGKPGLIISFHKGLNALIGENDSGKTAIIDAIKIVLLTQSNEYIRVTDTDFYIDQNGEACKDLKIELSITDFSSLEAKNFIEYLSFTKSDDKVVYTLNLYFHAWKEKNRIYTDLRAGDPEDGKVMDSRARELLKVVYLKPLRDAEREMRSGRNSRISQILLSHPLFQASGNQKLKDIVQRANSEIQNYFTEDEGKGILQTLRSTLDAFNENDVSSEATLETSNYQLKAILESLSLSVAEIQPGLGELNLLYMAAELLLLRNDDSGGIKLALIEELEAHLHPQAQLRLINYLQKEYDEAGAQIIISTHSAILASKINLKNIVLIKNNAGYDLSYGKTKLEKGDYLFLQRFLDSTKANMFFAKGLIMVEGDAENILVPVIADIIDCPLEKFGISVVNVGSTAFLRYSRIMARNDGGSIGIPVSIITDCDIKPEFCEEKFDKRLLDETNQKIASKKEYYQTDSIEAFVSPCWTLEYCLALSSLSEMFHKAVNYGIKIKNSNKYTLTEDKIIEADKITKNEEERWKDYSPEVKAYKIYNKMLNENGKSGLKAIVAQCLASMLRWKYIENQAGLPIETMFDLDLYQCKINKETQSKLKDQIEKDRFLEYIVKAIRHAASVE